MFEGPKTGYLGANDPSALIGEGALAIAQVSQLQGQLDAKASLAQLTDAIATREPTIIELPQSKVTSLVSDLAARATTQQLADAIATREPTITELPQSKVAGLVSDLAAKASAGALATVNANLT